MHTIERILVAIGAGEDPIEAAGATAVFAAIVLVLVML